MASRASATSRPRAVSRDRPGRHRPFQLVFSATWKRPSTRSGARGLSIVPPDPEFGFPRVAATLRFPGAAAISRTRSRSHIRIETISGGRSDTRARSRAARRRIATGTMTAACVTRHPRRLPARAIPDDIVRRYCLTHDRTQDARLRSPVPDSSSRDLRISRSSSQISPTPYNPAPWPPRLTPVQWLICAHRRARLRVRHLRTADAAADRRAGAARAGECARRARRRTTTGSALLFWIPAVAGGIFGLLGGYLTDRLGRRRVLTWSILLYAFSAFAAGFSTNIWQFLFFRCTTFIGVCVEFVAAVAWLAELFPDPKQREKRARLHAGVLVGRRRAGDGGQLPGCSRTARRCRRSTAATRRGATR